MLFSEEQIEEIAAASKARRKAEEALYGPETPRMRKARLHAEDVIENGYRCRRCGKHFRSKAKLHNHGCR